MVPKGHALDLLQQKGPPSVWIPEMLQRRLLPVTRFGYKLGPPLLSKPEWVRAYVRALLGNWRRC